MSKSKKIVGQPILSQVIDCISSSDSAVLMRKHMIDRYYKRLPFCKHGGGTLWCFSYRNGLRELCEGLLGYEGKLTHLGLDASRARSTLSDANPNRSYLIYEDLYFKLLGRCHRFVSDSRLKGLRIEI